MEVKVLRLMITCYLFGTAFSATLFAFDFPAPPKAINTGFDGISQTIRPNNNNERTSSPFDSFNPFSYEDNSRNKPKENFSPAPTDFITSPIGFVKKLKPKPEQPLAFIDKLKQDINKNAGTEAPDRRENRKSFANNKVSEPMASTEQASEKTGLLEEGDSYVTFSWSENGTDYTTETSEYETTTDELLNRVGAPPAVIASLLGG